MDPHKRKFPYHSEVGSFNVKRPGAAAGYHPGREAAETRIYQEPNYYQDAHQQAASTDFSTWTPDEIKVFLDQRGGDFDDCHTFDQLVERAQEVEINTGPAVRPSSQPHGSDAGAGDVDGDEPAPRGAAAGGAGTSTGGADVVADDDEYDPLDAFMAEIDQEVAANKPAARQPKAAQCDETADPATEYMEVRKGALAASQRAAAAAAAGGYDSDEEVYATAKALDAATGGGPGAAVESDEDDPAALARAGKRPLEPLAPLDHGSIEYEPFAKDFYEEPKDIAAMGPGEVDAYRRELELRVSGFDVPRPVRTFAQCGFDAQLMSAIKKAGYEKPTPIQAQALPVVLSGRDVLGVAKTGSGKTAAFVLPMLVHIMDQRELAKGEGPIGLVLAPTRELAEQIHRETRRFAKPYALRCAAAFGGLNKFEQFKDLKAGSEVAVATPGRMIDLIKMKACTCTRVTYLVFDEADRMFDMGFEPQVRSILGQVRPDRQTLLFSATMPRKVEALAGDALSSPVRITVGAMGVANADVVQRVEVLADDAAKMSWITSALGGLIDEGDVIVFAGQRARVEALAQALGTSGARVGAIHGDMDQYSRMSVLDGFKSGSFHVLVATDVAARGLDIRTIKTVVNYDAARDLDTHIHRVGRTGRAGDKEGVAITLLTPGDARFAGQLLHSLALAGQQAPQQLVDLAMKDASFHKGNSRTKGGKGGKGRRPQVGGAGLGFGPGGSGAGGGGGGGGMAAFTSAGSGGGMNRAGAGAFVQLSGFSKSTDDYEHEPSAAAGRPDPPAAAHGAHSSVTAAVSAAAAPAASTASARAEVAGQMRSLMAGKFKSSFVSSGTTGGDIGAAPTIVLPKASTAGQGSSAPPPVPVSQLPHYLTAQHGGGGSGRFGAPPQRGLGGFGNSNTAQPPASTSYGAYPPPPALPSGSGSSGSYRNMPPPPNLNAVPPPSGNYRNMPPPASLSAASQPRGAGSYGGGTAGLPAPGSIAASPAAAAAAIANAQAIAARLAAAAAGAAPAQDQQQQQAPPRNRWG